MECDEGVWAEEEHYINALVKFLGLLLIGMTAYKLPKPQKSTKIKPSVTLKGRLSTTAGLKPGG